MDQSAYKKIFIASDHGGWELKQLLLTEFPLLPWEDLGCHNTTSVNYPDYAKNLAEKLLDADNQHIGVLICGSGQGMAMAANKHRHIRAALCWSEEIAALSKEHNNANVLCLGGRFIGPTLATKILNKFLTTEFAGGRHEARIQLFSKTNN